MRLSSVAGVWLAGFSLLTAAVDFRLISPSTGQTLHGLVLLRSSASAGVSQVEYRIGSHRLGSARPPGFQLRWNSAESMDGTVGVQAVAFDRAGTVVSQTECVVRIANRGATVEVNSPDLNRTLSGTIELSLTGTDSPAFPAVWMLNVDGEEQSTVWTDNTWRSPISVRLPLDTTRFSNGPHELQISMNSRRGPANPAWVNWRGMVNRVVSFQNGRTWMDSAPESQNVYLRPGERLSLQCRRCYTDGSQGNCVSPSYRSADASIAEVDRNGVITARGNGFTRIELSDGLKTGETHVWVAPNSQIPHFAGDGEFLHFYDARRSFLPIAPFFLDPDLLRHSPALEAALHRAGVNTLSFGLYPNPRNIHASYDAWREGFDATILPKLLYARSHGFHLLLTGDDMARRMEGDARFTLDWPGAPSALAYAMEKLAGTGVGIGLDVIDEASRLWGPQPPPALTTIRGWLTSPRRHVPISWPALAADAPAVQGNWMGRNSISDYASHYFTSRKTRTTYPWSEGIQEMVSSMQTEFFDRQPFMMLDRPQLMLVSLAGPSYTKAGGAAARFAPEVDALEYPGVGPDHVSALMMTAMALGGAGLRLYYFEPGSDLSSRAGAKSETYFQTGADPSVFQPESWHAMALAANLLTRILKPYLLGAQLSSPSYGRNIITAVRQGEDGVLLLIVNGNDWTRTIRPDIGRYGGGGRAMRYRLSATRLETSGVVAAAAEELTLAAGESVAYIFTQRR